MRLIQFRFENNICWGEFSKKENICLNFREASGISDVRTYLNSNKRISLGELRKYCLENKFIIPFERIELIAPVFPGTIFGVGLNHKVTWKGQESPVLFLKAVQSAIGHKEDIVIPPFAESVFPEVELGVVIGLRSSIFGYTIVNDVTLRGCNEADIWFYAKSHSTFTPLGPWIITKDKIRNHNKLKVFVEVNERVEIRGNTSDLIFTPEQVIAAISKNVKLMPGDLIAMGCPGTPDKLKHGDRIKVGIEGIGVLENPVVKKKVLAK